MIDARFLSIYPPDFRHTGELLCQATVESIVRERFGSKCFRIFRLLLLKYVGIVIPLLFPGLYPTKVIELVPCMYIDRGVEGGRQKVNFLLTSPSPFPPSLPPPSFLPLSSLPSSLLPPPFLPPSLLPPSSLSPPSPPHPGVC